MSVTDELTHLEEHVRTRLRELKPLVEEYNELEAIAQRLAIAIPEPTGAARPRRRRASPAHRARAKKTTATPARSARAAKAGNGRRTPAGKRRDDVLAAVTERPGITVRELGEQLGVDPTSLYRVIHGLEADGLITKVGRGLQPPGASAVTAAPDNHRASGSLAERQH